MPSAYIYMEHPQTAEVLTLGKLTLQPNRPGEFVYSPAALESRVWVPDPIRYPLSDRVFTINTNQGVPGFIDDAMPDGWGERLLQRMQRDPVSRFDLLIGSPNNDRVGNLMTGRDRVPPPGVGQKPLPRLDGLDKFIDICEVVYDNDVSEADAKALGMRDQRSSVGGARPKRTFAGDRKLILAKPHDRYDQYELAPVEHACMTFAARKGMRVANTSLYQDRKGATLLVERFDRRYTGGVFRRVPLLSALTLLDTEWAVADLNARSYARFADEMHRRGVPDEDRRELYRRMAYNALVGNADDHPRNHAIIFVDGVWRLSPMYDVLPILDEGRARYMSMSVGVEGANVSRANLLSQHRHFSLEGDEAEEMLEEVAGWAEELRDYYGNFLKGQTLELAREATSAAGLLA
ncbi:type II toxin-antitoxin system HipA family toxin [Pseudomonas sp. GD04058]|uniref:type II toxin-antitoxin system HipA family toxin n=1 Tax=Pseudomonas sp. GD04058 TaxID=2975429 RepID=UPI00244D60B8|nr:type II toxin-antitoxin system HipA family toxin [Pseudomonas sp. GD04058]MDG9881971.1 type II toxin-antitoxin system HipA family toxin [Pseudomonas sp. GD04058]